MNAKQAEQCTGISRRNLRFYEQQGLIHPARNPANDYRDYSQQDIDTLKFIRALRMLDTPLRTSPPVSKGRPRLQIWPQLRKRDCSSDEKSWTSPLPFARKLQGAATVDAAFVDSLLQQMDAPEIRSSLFLDWKADYQKVAAAEHKKSFSFTPDNTITTASDFTNVLFRLRQRARPQSGHHQRGAGAGI